MQVIVRHVFTYSWSIRERLGFPEAQLVKNLPAMQETLVLPGSGRSPGEGIGYPLQCSRASLVAQLVRNLPTMQGTWVRSLGWKDALEEG